MSSRVNFQKVFCLFLLLTLVGCSAERTVTESPSENLEVMGPVIPEGQVEEGPADVPEIYGPEAPPEGQVTNIPRPGQGFASEAPGPASPAASVPVPSADSAKLCLVLGPGMAKAMAEAAVLDVLRKGKMPVHCVVGVEMGAIVGALYSRSSGNTNNLLWQLFKLNKDNYLNFPMLSLREPKSSGTRLNEFFRGLFRDTQIEQLPIRFATSAIDDERDVAVDFDRGDLANALSSSVAVAGVFDSWKYGKLSYRSGVFNDPAPVELARKLGGNFIVIVDVLLESGGTIAKTRYHRVFSPVRSLMKLQKKEANFVIEVNTGAIAFDDFNRKGEILAAGTAAAERSMPQLKAAWEKWIAESH